MRNLATILLLQSKLSGKFQCFNTIDRSIKILKNFKTFYETQTVSRFQEVIQPSPSPPPLDKMLLRLWNKNFLTEIYRNIQTFAFKLLQKCSSWASGNIAVQMFYLTPSRNMSVGKSLKLERFLALLREHIICNVKSVEVRKMSNAF